MPRQPRPPIKRAPRGHARKRVGMLVRVDLWEWLEARATENGMTATAELETILESLRKLSGSSL